MFPDRDPLNPHLDLLALRYQVGIVTVGVVNESAIIGVEWLCLDGTAILTHRIGKLLDTMKESIITHGTVMLDINDDSLGFVILCNQQAIY